MHHKRLFLLVAALVLSSCGNDAVEEPAAEPAVAEESATAEAPAAAPEPAPLPRTASVTGAGVYFITPADGDTVRNPIVVEFGIDGMAVTTAGDDAPHTGHHHLLIDAELPELSLPIPANENYIHFGDGSTSTQLSLAPGTHTLQLLLGDHLHIPHDPPVKSAPITIVVE
jgi:hypothetical protein